MTLFLITRGKGGPAAPSIGGRQQTTAPFRRWMDHPSSVSEPARDGEDGHASEPFLAPVSRATGGPPRIIRWGSGVSETEGVRRWRETTVHPPHPPRPAPASPFYFFFSPLFFLFQLLFFLLSLRDRYSFARAIFFRGHNI
jgi:hypothetical protein